MLVVLDTNVLVFSLLNPFGKPAAVLGLILEEKAAICYDSRIIAEYMDVLHRSKFHFPPREISDLIDFLRACMQSVLSRCEAMEHDVYHDKMYHAFA